MWRTLDSRDCVLECTDERHRGKEIVGVAMLVSRSNLANPMAHPPQNTHRFFDQALRQAKNAKHDYRYRERRERPTDRI